MDTDHNIEAGRTIRQQGHTASPIEICSDVWIAANCTVLRGSKIGDGAVIGAKSLVKGEVPENSVCVGIPVKVKKFRE